MNFLLVRPQIQHRVLTPVEIDITNILYEIAQQVVFDAQRLRIAADGLRGNQAVAAFSGTFYDRLVKERVRQEINQNNLPADLHVTPTASDPGVRRAEARGPDFLRGTAAWDLTTAESGGFHVRRDVFYGLDGLQVYFVLDY